MRDRFTGWDKPGAGVQRVMFTFMTCDGKEGYVLAQYPAPDTIFKVRILGDKYLRWTMPGYLSVEEIKAELVHYFKTRREMRGDRMYG